MADAYAFRRLGGTDVAAIRALLDVFAVAFDEAEVYGFDPPDDAELARRLGKADTIVVVAETESRDVVGGLIAHVLDKFEQVRTELYIYDLAVAEPHRRRGVARGAIQYLQTLAPDVGAWVMFVQADPQDAPALALYRAVGTEELVFHFDVPVRSRQQ